MNIYEVLVIVTFVMCAIIMISQYIDRPVPLCSTVSKKRYEPVYHLGYTCLCV